MHSTQSVNTGGALAANKSARAMLGPPDTALLHVCGPPRPGVANRPSSGACCVGLGQGQRGAHRRGSRGQRRVTYQRTRLIKPRSASHGKAAAMRARIAGPSITHSSNKAWRTGDFGPSNVALLVGQWVLPGRQNSVRRGRKPREKSKIDQTLRSGSFEFDLCQKSRGSSPKRTNSIPASSSLNSPNSGIGLFYAESGFFDGKNLDFWRIGSKPFLWRILKTGEKAICRHVTEPLCISQREKVKREILSFWWSSFCLNLQIQELRNAVIGDTNTREDGGRGRRAARPRGAARRRGRRCRR